MSLRNCDVERETSLCKFFVSLVTEPEVVFQEAGDLGLLAPSFAIPDLVFVFLKSPDII